MGASIGEPLMSFQEKLSELSALGAEIAGRRHQIGTLEIDRSAYCDSNLACAADLPEFDAELQRIDRKLLAERLDLHLAETRRDVLRLELTWSIADRQADALLGLPDVEDI
jgi:hypothetical protein